MAISGASPISITESLISPVWQFATPEFHYALGLNTASRDRYNLYRNNVQACLYPRGPDRTPNRLNFAQLLQLYNQGPWTRIGNDPVLFGQMWEHLRYDLRQQGIDIPRYEDRDADVNALLPGQFIAEQWARLIDMGCSAAPLNAVLRDYYRSQPLEGDRKVVTQEEMTWNLQRAQFRRKEDRDRILAPFHDWTPDEITRCRRMGVISRDIETSLLNAAGITRTEDYEIREHLERIFPDPQTLMHWSARRLWDANITENYGLDEDYNESPIAKFFAAAQGVGRITSDLPNQPRGETDWAKLTYRASRPLPTFHVARELQHRLRPLLPRGPDSVVEGIEVWTADDTKAMLTAEGYTEPVIKRMMALVTEPVNLQLIVRVLVPMLENPALKALAEEHFGQEEDWIKSSLLDHGFSEEISSICAKAIWMEAEATHNAEMTAHKKAIREEKRKLAIARYELGTMSGNDARQAMQDDQYTYDMARDALNHVDQRFDLAIAEAKIKALHEAYMTGHLNQNQIGQQLDAIPVDAARKRRYLEQWQWERTANQRTLTTAEILNALKTGLVQPQQALMRLQNLGWAGADAMIEIAQVQHEIAVTQQKTLATQALHAQAAAKAQARELATARAKQLSIAERTARLKARLTHAQATAIHRDLLAESTYFAKVHGANSAYAKAEKAKDQEKMFEELAKEIAAYHHWQIEQINLANESPEIARETGPIDTQAAPGPQQGQGANQAPSSANPPAGRSTGTTGGNAQPAPTGPALPGG